MSTNRYARNKRWFRRCGGSGLKLPAVSFGCWNNFGATGTASHGIADESAFHEYARNLIWTAFDHGITHFDFANNYGPPPGTAEERCGRIFAGMPREELIISSKAGWDMWPGPYGDGGSRKYLVTSCDHSLKRLGGDYLDIFYHHRPDPETPLEESLGALDFIVRSGRALYTGISSYPGHLVEEAMRICEREGFIKPIIHQPLYNMLDRGFESDVLPAAQKENMGVICFCPLSQGILTDKYLNGIPEGSRAANPDGTLKESQITSEIIGKIAALNNLAQARGQSMAQMAVAWVLRHDQMTSALIGASRPEQIVELSKAADAPGFSEEELNRIEDILKQAKP
jgi:L-glyceraldehyde 3-phosphate reductase